MTQRSPVRVAVIGAMGRNHARVYSEMPDVRLVGVADADPRAAKVVASRSGGKANAVAKEEPLRAETGAFLAAVPGEAPEAVRGADGLQALALAQAVVKLGEEHRALILE
jgi:predicted dehydrogenase